ncbi:maleylpyruvate isomerase family mycothiol-dependent enzyme [Actinoplanes bogorensis]|uniref:Maleylpyruvate isomerase family mycothiol-dependent enzyme n=1 Tax=Paractinoplanes bogorensis TaxID=1610840 RepID=A0ABS5YRK4_9ACTN|nr:maleylpyruvate isomerase family mycothiol-dependent enzyme [Actinoplanes bogorensis]MBU2665359.1 maleylpyruvate isomerase family mycothiol-dependent enzyme [Actinoplanes bogorensis]
MTPYDTLGSLWSVWASYGSSLTPAQWETPTRLEPWTVRALFAHTAQWPHWLTHLVTRTRDTPPTFATTADLLRSFNAPGGVAGSARTQVSGQAVDDAAKFTPEQMTEAFAVVGPPALDAARALGDDVVIDYFGMGQIPLAEMLGIGIVEATVHLLDLERALGVEPAVPAEGLARTSSVLAAMATPVDVIEGLTGRTPFTPVLT